MSAINGYREALEKELKHWPDVFWEWQGLTRHDRVIFYHGMDTAVHTISRTTAGRIPYRGTANMRSEIRRLLKGLGAERT